MSTITVDDLDLDGGVQATKFQLDKTYVDGGEYQYAAEIERNVSQLHDRMVAAGADTSKVKLSFDFVQATTTELATNTLCADPVLRRAWNIGTPMDPESELLAIYSKLNVGGGENRWSPENLGGSYGMGVRAALLYWTDVAFISSVPGKGSFGIILRRRNGEDGKYGIARAVNFDEDGDAIPTESELFKLPLVGSDDGLYVISPDGENAVELSESLVDESVREHGGMTLVFLGKNGYTEDTEFDTHNAEESSYGLAPFLRDRFIGGKFPVTVLYRMVRGTSKESGSFTHDLTGGKVFYDSRVVKPLSAWTDRATKLHPVDVDGHGTIITPYLLPEDYFHTGAYTTEQRDVEQAKDSTARFDYRSDGTWGRVSKTLDKWYPFSGRGQAIVVYKDEMYVLRDSSEDRAKALSQWGISRPSVADRVLLVIEPRRQNTYGPGSPWGITQNAARSNVTGPYGSALPISTWQAAFTEAFPEEIEKALSVRPTGAFKAIPEDEISRLMDRALGAKGKTRGPKVKVKADSTATGEGEEDGTTIVTSAGTGKGKGGGGAASKESKVVKGDKGGIKSVARTAKLPMPPQPEFLDPEEWADKGFPASQFCHVSLEGSTYAIHLNRGDDVFATQVRYYWTDMRNGHFSQPRRKGVLAKILRNHGGRTPGAKEKAMGSVIDEIEYVYRHDAMAQFLGAMSRYVDEKGRLDRALFNDAITNGSQTMTVGLSALYPQQASITDRLNSLANDRKLKSD